jgi:ABC-type Fe3+/spermidine/putrescine transport system ATPase subunit
MIPGTKSMRPSFLQARNLVKRFGKVAAVNDIGFDVGKGEVLTLLGPSGCGKTTTLRLLAGFERPDRGEVEVDGRTIVSVGQSIFLPPEKREMGMVFQSYAIWPHLSVFENVAYPLKLRRVRGAQLREKVQETLELVGLGGLGDRPAPLLSGGQQQRVALARSLVYSPSILLLDEPLSNLDAKLREQMRIELKSLQRRLSITVVFVTHDQIEAMTLSDRLAVMNLGRIEQLASPAEVYEQPMTPFVQEFIGRVIWLNGAVVDITSKGISVGLQGGDETEMRCDHSGEEMKEGDLVIIAIRPEEVRVSEDHEGNGLNQVPCFLETAVFLGDHYECHFRYGDVTFSLPAPRAQILSPGRKVFLTVPPESVRIWRKG